MVFKSIILIVFLMTVIGLGATAVFQKLTRQDEASWEEKHSLRSIATRTKADGKQSVTIPAPRIDYPGANVDLDEALGNSSIVVADPIESQSYVVNGDGITTWYKFSVKEYVSKKSPTLSDMCPRFPDLPQDLTPPQDNEFFLAAAGGSVWLDGVETKMENRALPEFQNETTYLLFLSIGPSGIARLAAGPSGVFRVKDNEILEPVDRTRGQLKEGIRAHFASSLFSVKAHVRD